MIGKLVCEAMNLMEIQKRNKSSGKKNNGTSGTEIRTRWKRKMEVKDNANYHSK